ncbi:imelysin family protein [Catenovulum adriaticum]|uniref:Imelysin family protein n=1 Tax=Catenovulum adriaticum TaxID=2984846 RepID=A0ABY7ASA4_9ALTE|nr:imelysin family protein [Catenovulum sp. TS8]WAJ71551.1 imelysin family protein [Catenovulum sp. TS8]
MKTIQNNKCIGLFVSLFLLASCGESVESQAGSEYGLTSNFTESELINHLTDKVIKPRHLAFLDSVEHQVETITNYCQTLADTDNMDKTQVQQAFKNSLANWQQIEVMQMQILSADTNALRSQIYSWPDSTTSCGVDQDVAFYASGSVNGQPYNIKNRLNNRKGLDALEYLLFTENLNHSCKVESGALTGWNELNSQTRKIQRCEYAALVSQDILDTFKQVENHWYQGQTPYIETLKQGDVREAINTLGQALFYVDFLKDNKLGVPLGYFSNQCGNAPCPNDIESQYSQLSLTNIQHNLIAFKALFTGETEQLSGDNENALGFDDYLAAVGDSETSDTILARLAQAQQVLESINADFATALTNQGDEFIKYQTLHAEFKAITDQLKTHFITSLAVELPDSSAGDND